MKIRKAILTGGGRATRLHPITTTINKHLLPLANKPMIFHAIEKAVAAGITEIFINTNPGETELQKHIGDGGHWGISITYFEQTGGPQGIAHVVQEAERFIGKDPFLFYLSDNILLGSLKDMVDEFKTGTFDCMLALSKVSDPQRFGVPIFNDQNELVDVWEKPQEPPNNFAVTGIYMYGPKVFFDAYKNIEPSARGEFEISSIHSDLLKRGLKVGSKEITGWWRDTGKIEDLLTASRLLLETMGSHEFPNHGSISEDTHISGNVQIGIGAQIGPGVTIEGPAIIGENCVLKHCHIGPYVTLSGGCDIQKVHIENSIVLDNAMIDAPMRIIDSLIGKNAQLIKRNTGEPEGHKMIIGDKTIIEM